MSKICLHARICLQVFIFNLLPARLSPELGFNLNLKFWQWDLVVYGARSKNCTICLSSQCDWSKGVRVFACVHACVCSSCFSVRTMMSSTKEQIYVTKLKSVLNIQLTYKHQLNPWSHLCPKYKRKQQKQKKNTV